MVVVWLSDEDGHNKNETIVVVKRAAVVDEQIEFEF